VARVNLLLFAAAREAAGTKHDTVDGATVGEVLAIARTRYGDEFATVLAGSRVWLDGEEPASGDATPVVDGAEVAVLPPVSGGADGSISERAADAG
jgi:molybdopterin synthase sulfur carrier subunit